MLSFLQDIFILVLTTTGSLLLVATLNRFWPKEKRRVHNDLIGWQLGILGTTYAVILGFMLYTVWTDFGLFSASMFGSESAALHAIQVFSFTLLIMLALLAIADVNLPFQGWVHISDYAFQRARQNMQ